MRRFTPTGQQHHPSVKYAERFALALDNDIQHERVSPTVNFATAEVTFDHDGRTAPTTGSEDTSTGVRSSPGVVRSPSRAGAARAERFEPFVPTRESVDVDGTVSL